ncbi:hypothetical protein BCR37DRAFT_386445 [Protomyces lactucae-debilis]|uniref:G-protein coupled receptors family 1 profile domain-containing protein n=1 Tax=Protomyces lactucae-debilis TaxID=2754530 RepID=A0A1Y2FJV5_PROLT|nr:uncharacterized protein BCR37DRAFT_386445 [Protomyces lactucae-debilis]ORY84251.1 hypothetical protein BCR37DRAFT_386445 [Protomyces lactucae-debilis]
MGQSQSSTLGRLAAAGPWTETRPLPAPFSQIPLQPGTEIVMKVVTATSTISLVTLLAVACILRWLAGRGELQIDFRALRRPESAQSQLLILLGSLLLAQTLLALGSFCAAFHLIRGAMIAPSTLCWAQGMLHGTGGFLSHCSIAAIGTHSLLSVYRLKPLQLPAFASLLAIVYAIPFCIGSLFPLVMGSLYDVPFMVATHFACYVNILYMKKFTYVIVFPFGLLFSIGLITFPLASLRLSFQTRRLLQHVCKAQSQQEINKRTEYGRTSTRMLMFPLVAMLATLPFLVVGIGLILRPSFFQEHIWPETITGHVVSIKPIIDVVLFGMLYIKWPSSIKPKSPRKGPSFGTAQDDLQHLPGSCSGIRMGTLRPVDVEIFAASDLETHSLTAAANSGSTKSAELAHLHSLVGIQVSQKTVRTVHSTFTF